MTFKKKLIINTVHMIGIFNKCLVSNLENKNPDPDFMSILDKFIVVEMTCMSKE